MTEQKTAAELLLESRVAVYGDRVDNMVRTAQMWGALLGVEIQPWQVPFMMSSYKMLRAMQAPD